MNTWGERASRFVAGLGMGVLAILAAPAVSGLWTGGTGPSVARADDAPDPGRDILVFVDETGSTGRQFDVYRRALLDRIVPELKAGDRLRVAPIVDDNSLVSNFMAEGILPGRPSFDSLSDNEIDYKNEVKKEKARDNEIRATLLTTLKVKLAKPGKSRYTDLFGAARMASQLFSADRRRPIVVFLSDMQEDRGRFRYRDMKWNDRDLKRVEKAYGFPDLKNVCVYVIGTRSPSIEKTRKMGEFWLKYFKKSGADISPSHIGSMLVNWPPGEGCGKPRALPKKGESWLQKLRKQL